MPPQGHEGILTVNRSSIAKKLWTGWLAFARMIGTIQMLAIVTLVDFTLILPVAIPFKLMADPLRLKRRRGSQWQLRIGPEETLESMRRQG